MQSDKLFVMDLNLPGSEETVSVSNYIFHR